MYIHVPQRQGILFQILSTLKKNPHLPYCYKSILLWVRFGQTSILLRVA